MRRISRIIISMLLLLILTGCYMVADSDYSVPGAEVSERAEEETRQESECTDPADSIPEESSEETTEDEPQELSADSEAFIRTYVPKLYDLGEEYHLYQKREEAEDGAATDLLVRVTQFDIGDQQLSPEFDYLGEEDHLWYECSADETIVYYTLEITAGDQHKPEGSDYLMCVNGTSLFNVREVGGESITGKLFDFDYTFFAPVENSTSTKDIGKITLMPGETKVLTYAEKIRNEALEHAIYLNVDLLGTNMFDPDNTKPEQLTDEQRSMLAIYKVWEGKES